MFERDLDSIHIGSLSRWTAPGGQDFLGFQVRFSFKSSDGKSGGPAVEVGSSIELAADATLADLEAACLQKARAIVANLAGRSDEEINATIAAQRTEASKTEAQRTAEFQAELQAAMSSQS